jgi:phosphohistidine phosphatase
MLYLVHHADALPPEVDAQRPLSIEGRTHAERLAREIARMRVEPDVVWHSGKLRARQTAETFWRACNPLAEFAAIRGLQPTDPPEWIKDTVTGDPREIMLVGHMPHLPRAYHLFVSGTSEGAPSDFPLHGIVALELVGDGWVERWRRE